MARRGQERRQDPRDFDPNGSRAAAMSLICIFHTTTYHLQQMGTSLQDAVCRALVLLEAHNTRGQVTARWIGGTTTCTCTSSMRSNGLAVVQLLVAFIAHNPKARLILGNVGT